MRHHLRHHVARPGIVEPREQDQRAKADVSVGVCADSVNQRGDDGLGGRRGESVRAAAVRTA